MSTKILTVAADCHILPNSGGGVYWRGIRALLENISDTRVVDVVLPTPWQGAPTSIRRLRALFRAFNSSWPSKSHYAVSAGSSALVARAIERERPDLVLLNSSDLLPLLEGGGVDRYALLSHNIETQALEAKISALRLPGWARLPLLLDVRKLRQYEVSAAHQAELVISISHSDAMWFRRTVPRCNVVVIPCVFPYAPSERTREPSARPLRIAMVAKFQWWPNAQGIQWFLQEVLPRLPSASVEVDLYGLGSERYDGFAPNVRGHGFVESLERVWASANFTICPVLSGSGINVKVAESLYNGIPVLTTPKGRRGFEAISDSELVCRRPEEWASFLGSDAARRLADVSVSKRTERQFSMAYRTGELEQAITSIIQS